MGPGIPPLKSKIMLESNPPNSRILVRRLAGPPPKPTRRLQRRAGFGRGEVRTTSLRARSAFTNIICGRDALQAGGFVQTSDLSLALGRSTPASSFRGVVEMFVWFGFVSQYVIHDCYWLIAVLYCFVFNY